MLLNSFTKVLLTSYLKVLLVSYTKILLAFHVKISFPSYTKDLATCFRRYPSLPMASTLDRLKEAIRRKRPGLLRKGCCVQYDNAIPHSANITQQWLQRYGWEILPHPAHSPDLAPSDFHFVWTLEAPFRRHGFRDRR
ncbi:histone-lysine N-methyltransferase SETMAR [Plakobranchus ocellatus]|uniref:Histone-lysine N-methyltransferase SETMAR n=1 Tax=Plakobranchus ocellatus TaxID=259542 RepID=A0AAV4DG62_9GAST|nr:histone-lysine N-methyltransferase SETMAR [Plakobranchus ocellatus]